MMDVSAAVEGALNEKTPGNESWKRMSHESSCRRWLVVVRLALLTVILCGEVSSQSEFGPQPPCGNAAFPAYPEAG